MGAITISYQTIWAWGDLMQNAPTPFDVKTLRDMSLSYIAMQEIAKKNDTPDPLKDLKNV